MTIASSSGLSDKDIERMVSDAEQYAEADKARRDIIEKSNKAESVCTDTEKGMSSIHQSFVFITNIVSFAIYSDERVQGPA